MDSGLTGQFADRLLAGWQQFLDKENDAADAGTYIEPAAASLARLVEATTWIREADGAAARGAALDYQRLFALTTIACLWAQIIASIRGKDGDFYETKRKTARFYMEQVLPQAAALHAVVTDGAEALAAYAVEDFGT